MNNYLEPLYWSNKSNSNLEDSAYTIQMLFFPKNFLEATIIWIGFGHSNEVQRFMYQNRPSNWISYHLTRGFKYTYNPSLVVYIPELIGALSDSILHQSRVHSYVCYDFIQMPLRISWLFQLLIQPSSNQCMRWRQHFKISGPPEITRSEGWLLKFM